MNHITTRSPRSHAELVHNLLNEMQRSGIAPSDPGALVSRLADGQIIRFSTVTKPRKKNGYLIVHFDRGLPVVAIAGDWSLDTQMMWQAFNLKALTATERRQFREKMERARAKREAELARQHLARSQYAARLYRETQPADEHFPYLKKKGIRSHKARQNGNLLVLPLTDFNGKIWSLQTIDPDGKKRLLAGGRKAGNFIVVDGPDYPARVLICEGWATGCTLAETDSDALVLAAVDAGNLRTVATGARNRWPDADLIVCGDDDRKTPGNPGATAARAAALAAGARFALPEWPPAAPLHLSDFNDLANWQKGAA